MCIKHRRRGLWEGEQGSEGDEREVEEGEKVEGGRGRKGEETEGRGKGMNLPHGRLKTLAALTLANNSVKKRFANISVSSYSTT